MNGTNLSDLTPRAEASQAALTIGLVNNMPPAASGTTERQFRQLLAAAGGEQDVRLHCHRADLRSLDSGRLDMDAFLETELDGLIVTGAEPQASALREEPIWPLITRLVDWAEERSIPTIWSCLAAHAAVHYIDGVDRIPLDRKTSGLFKGEVVAFDHPLMDGLTDAWSVPHSRCNDIPEETLKANGYRILVRSPQAGVDLFQKASIPSFLFLQSHPEYDADTLRREFQRDVKRFQAGERSDPPAVPHGYFGSSAESRALPLHDGAGVSRENAAEVLAFLGQGVDRSVQAPWRGAAVTVFRNWLLDLTDRKARRDAQSAALAGQAPHRRELRQSGLMPC